MWIPRCASKARSILILGLCGVAAYILITRMIAHEYESREARDTLRSLNLLKSASRLHLPVVFMKPSGDEHDHSATKALMEASNISGLGGPTTQSDQLQFTCQAWSRVPQSVKPALTSAMVKVPENYEDFCQAGIPCRYPDVVDIRIIVLTYNRHESLHRTLQSLDKLVIDNQTSSLEIFIDRSKNGSIHAETLSEAKSFHWSHGPTRVHVQRQHVGIYGQWIDTWRPPLNSGELALILEDDVDTSPFALRWLRAVHDKYGGRPDISGYCLQDENVPIVQGKLQRKEVYQVNKELLMKHPVYLFRVPGSWGFAPLPSVWSCFQDWFHGPARNITHPYSMNAVLNTKWYKIFEKQGRADSMWTMWFIFYTEKLRLFAAFSNLPSFSGQRNASLVFNRREAGLHFGKRSKPLHSSEHLMTAWSDKYISFYDKLPALNHSGHFTGYI